MRRYKDLCFGFGAAAGMLILILDTKTALSGASEGIELCIRTVIPSLFPFFLLSQILTWSLAGKQLPGLAWLRKVLRIPAGAEVIYLSGLLGGYPVGAQSIANACKSGSLSPADGNRMIAFCSNAGPAFIFGIGSAIFDNQWLCWLVWMITVCASVIVAILTPGFSGDTAKQHATSARSLVSMLRSSVITMGIVCGWVILFRVMLAFADRWFLWLLPECWGVLFYGIAELSNGCCSLVRLEGTIQLPLFVIFLSFGGLCVFLQTQSILENTGVSIRMYLPGKIAQAAIGYLLCSIINLFLPPDDKWHIHPYAVVLCIAICVIYGIALRKIKKPVAFPPVMLYNKEKVA